MKAGKRRVGDNLDPADPRHSRNVVRSFRWFLLAICAFVVFEIVRSLVVASP